MLQILSHKKPYFISTARKRRSRFRFQPSPEALEGRIVLTAYTFINPAGGSWDTATNWSPRGIPKNGDSVDIPALSGNAAVSLAIIDSVTLSSLTVSGKLKLGGILAVPSLSFDGTVDLTGSLKLGTASTQGALGGNGTLNLDGGELQEADVSSSVAVIGTGGTLNAVTLEGDVTLHGEPSIPYTDLYIQNGLTLNDKLTLSGSPTFGESANAMVFDGTQTLSGTGSVDFAGPANSTAVFKSVAGTTTIGSNVTVQVQMGNSATIGLGGIVDDGTLALDGGNGTENGLDGLSIATGGYLSLLDGTDAGTGADATLTNAGNVILSPGSTLQPGGGYTQTSTGTLTIQFASAPAPLPKQFPILFASGPGTLAGTLNATFINGFSPTPGQSFLIATFEKPLLGNANPLTGKFDTVNGGVATYSSSSSVATVILNIVQPQPNISLASAPNPSTYGQSVTFTATVSPATGLPTPTGTVTFMDGSTVLNPGGSQLNASGIATFTTSTLAVGPHSITAVYSGDSNYSGSVSPPISQTINASLPNIAVTTPSFDGADGGVDFSYMITGVNLPQPATIALYWSPVSTFNPTSPNQYTLTYSTQTQTAQSPTPIFVHVGPIGLTTQPPLGTKYLLVVADPNDQIAESNKTDNAGFVASPAAVVNVVTHGFNPNPLTSSFPSFRQPYFALSNELNNLPALSSPLYGQVKSYTSQWDSSSGWDGAIVSVIASLFLPFPLELLALRSAQLYMRQAAANAEQAAQTIDADITNPENGYLLSPNYGQIIDLIGHSRGAAVNARASQLLTNQGYTVDQYTSLDGYSTDWQFPSNLLGDISITGTATALRKVNYEVQQGLGQVVAPWLAALGIVLSAADVAALAALGTNWRAPDRTGFDNFLIPGPAPNGDPSSNHLNIVSIYSDSLNPYIYDNYEGYYSDNPNAPSGIAPPPDPPLTTPPSPVTYSNFTDGSFKAVGMFLDQLQAANISTGGDPLLSYWLNLVNDPTQLLASTWAVTGDAKLVQDGDHAVAELDQTAGGTSIGQYLELDPQASSIGFDMSVVSANSGDQLQVLLNNNVLDTIDLSSPSASGHETVSLAAYASQMGEVTFQLVGPAGDSAKVQLDNLTVNEANSPLTVDPVQSQSALAGTALVVPVTASDSIPGRTITYSLDPGAPAGATIDPNSGILTWDVPASETTGDFPVTVRVTDSGSPAASVTTSFTVTVGVIQQPTNLSTVSVTGAYGGTSTLTATLTAGLPLGGPPVAGKTVTFTLTNGGTVTNLGTATTDQNGIATLSGVSLAGFNVGTYSGAITANFAGDATDLGSTASGDLTVSQATPTIIWTNPSDITYGTTLGAAQLDATATDPTTLASLPGTFTYTLADGTTPASGAVLPAGAGQVLKVTFTPTDTTNYTTAAGSTTIDVRQATTAISTPATSTIVIGTPNTVLGGQITTNSPLLPSGESVLITFRGGGITPVSRTATIDGSGNFSASLPTGALPAGSYTVTYTYASDENFTGSENTSTLSVTYNVTVLTDLSKAKQSGSTIPIQLQLTDASGNNEGSAITTVTAVSIVDQNGNPVPLMWPGSSNPGGVFQYTSGTYQFNLKTTGYAAGRYTIYYKIAGDPTLHSASVQIR